MAINLIEKDTNITGYGNDILYVNGNYYLVSQKPAKVSYSSDLENWTEITLNDDYMNPTSIAYGNGIFVIVGTQGSTTNTYIYYSTDGLTWTPQKIDTGVSNSLVIGKVKFINNRFVFAVSYGQVKYQISNGKTTISRYSHIIYFESKNGSSWTSHKYTITGSETISFNDFCYFNNTYISVGSKGMILTSSNLSTWTQVSSNTTEYLNAVVSGKGMLVAVGSNGTVLTSTDGKNWQLQENKITSYLRSANYSNGMFILSGYNGALLQSTYDLTWKDVSINNSINYNGLTSCNERFVICGTKYSSTGTIPVIYFDISRELATTEDSCLFFFNKNLELLGIVDTFISLRWQRKYFEAGEFEIVLPPSDYIMKFINTDVLVMRNNYTEAGIIETIQIEDKDEENGEEEITISGRFLSSLFERRIIKSKINFSGNVIEGMNTLVNAMTPLTTNWEVKEVSMSSPAINFQCTYKNVYDYLCKLSEYSGIAFRIVPNVENKVYIFEVWKGLDRTIEQTENTRYAFSDDNYNISSSELLISSKTKVNYVLVGGTGEDNDRVLVEVDEGATGFDLYEVFADQKSSSNQDLSDTEYKNQLKVAGKEELSSETFEFDVEANSRDDYKVKWDLGDIVNVKKEKWNVNETYRIIEVEEVIEDGKKTILPKFGNILNNTREDDE